MSIAKYTRIIPTQNLRAEKPAPIEVSIDVREGLEPPVQSKFGVRREYILTANFRVAFFANDAQYEEAERRAYKTLVHDIHADELALIQRLRFAINNDDRELGNATLNKLQEAFEL